MRRPARSWGTDIAFADVAMAILGPIILLLLLFVLYAVGVGANATERCRTLSPDEQWPVVEQLNALIVHAEETISAADGIRRCDATIGDAPAQPAEPLSGLCPQSVDAILRTANIDQGKLLLLVARRAAALAKAEACLGSPCRQLSGQDREKRAGDLRSWLEQSRGQVRHMQAQLTDRCPTLVPTRAPVPLSPHSPTPPALADLCTLDRQVVLGGAGIAQTEIDQVSAEHGQILTQLLQCQPSNGEVVVFKETQLRFRRCSVAFVDGDNSELTTRQKDAFFDNLAQLVANKYQETHFGRIDIVGHTDSRGEPRFDGLCDGAPNNPSLSSLRAHVFREALIAAVDRNGDLAELREALNSQILRVYAIGVGSAERLRKPEITEADYAENRRIELRFLQGTNQVSNAQTP